jgi:serine/threonine protein kinase
MHQMGRLGSACSGGMNDYHIMGTLGRGAYGEVVLGKAKTGDQEVAIKMLDKKFLARVL